VWLDNDSAQRIIDGACQASLKLSKTAAEHAQGKVELAAHELACPACQRTMRTERIEKAWLDIDRCDEHGTWYDKGELERVARTAKIDAPKDWRHVQPPQTSPAPSSQAADDDSDDDSELAAEIAVEGGFLLIELLFAMVTD
jgi:Zn-finger nucleic acid-binding protein